MATTTRFGIAKPAGGDLINQGAAAMDAIADGFDAASVHWASGVFSARPAAGNVGFTYLATDVLDGGAHGTWYFDNGTAWEQINASHRGKSIIATTQSRTNTAYGLLTTPDKVNVTLAIDGLIVVGFQATWQESVAGAARAAIFVGSNQLKQAAMPSPTVQEASHGSTGGGVDHALGSYWAGLASDSSAASYSGDVTTGQVIGPSTSATSPGGFCEFFAAAGTYDVSVQFKASSGSVTVKNRKLWVEAKAYG